MKKILKISLFGFLLWLIPFVVSFAFYDRSGTLQVSYDLFKSVMIVISSLMGCYLIYLYFKKTEDDFMKEGLLIGITWLVINLVLDLCVLVPLTKMEVPHYFASIGLRYLQIPMMCIMAGALLQFQKQHQL